MSGKTLGSAMSRRTLVKAALLTIAAGNAPASRAMPYDPPSIFAGRKLRIVKVMQVAYDAGFVTEEQLTNITSIAIAESELYTQARNWHPERGYRSADDVITVRGPESVWKDGRQMHSDRGIWQIASFWYAFYPDSVVDNPEQAARIAYRLSGGGTDFTPWTSYVHNRAQKHNDKRHHGWQAVRPLVRRFLKKVEANQQVSVNNAPDKAAPTLHE